MDAQVDDLDKLDKQIAELLAEKQKLIDSKRDVVLAELVATIARYGFTAVDLGVATSNTKPPKPGKPKAPAKYADPNSEKTWAGGKGPTPKWVSKHLAAGGKLDDLLINKA